MAKDYKQLLARYGFTDKEGHALEACLDYLDLLEELHVLRAAQAPADTNFVTPPGTTSRIAERSEL